MNCFFHPIIEPEQIKRFIVWITIVQKNQRETLTWLDKLFIHLSYLTPPCRIDLQQCLHTVMVSLKS